MILDGTQNCLAWDNTETVEFQSTTRLPVPADPRPSSGMVDSLVAKRRAPTFKELTASGGVYTGQDLVWLIPAVNLDGGMIPKPSDVVVDEEGNRWTVLEVALNALKSTYRCMSRNLVLAHELRDIIQIERASISYDSAGAAVKWFPSDPPERRGGTVIYADLSARVQPTGGDILDERGIRGLTNLYDVIVGQEVYVTNEDRIFWQGKYLEIRHYQRAEQIDQLPVIQAEIVP